MIQVFNTMRLPIEAGLSHTHSLSGSTKSVNFFEFPNSIWITKGECKGVCSRGALLIGSPGYWKFTVFAFCLIRVLLTCSTNEHVMSVVITVLSTYLTWSFRLEWTSKWSAMKSQRQLRSPKLVKYPLVQLWRTLLRWETWLKYCPMIWRPRLRRV